MSEYKLTYFGIEALAEPIRMLLSYGKVDFVDNRVNSPEEWAKIKASKNFLVISKQAIESIAK
jgi:hypothetical protein